MSRNIWTKKEIQYLKKYYPANGAEKTAKHLGRSFNAVISQAMKLGITRENYRHWNSWEDNYIKRHYADREPESIARTLKRSRHAILNRAKLLGVTTARGKKWTVEDKAYLRKNYPVRSVSLDEICSYLHRSVQSIHSYSKYLNVRRPRHDHEWTKEEHDYLEKNYKQRRFKDIAVDLGLSSDAVVLYANRKGMFRKSKRRLWTEEDFEYVRRRYAIDTAEDIGKALERSVQAIRQCAGRLGLQGKQNWQKPANIEARVRKFKIWRAQQKK